jgi:type IV secretory pathway VirB10-like protein
MAPTNAEKQASWRDDSQVASGQDRLLLVWRLIMPNRGSIAMERNPATDPEGFIGLEDTVDQHWGRLFMGAVLSTVIGIGTPLIRHLQNKVRSMRLSLLNVGHLRRREGPP